MLYPHFISQRAGPGLGLALLGAGRSHRSGGRCERQHLPMSMMRGPLALADLTILHAFYEKPVDDMPLSRLAQVVDLP